MAPDDVGWSKTLAQTKMSQQKLNGLPKNLAQTFTVPIVINPTNFGEFLNFSPRHHELDISGFS